MIRVFHFLVFFFILVVFASKPALTDRHTPGFPDITIPIDLLINELSSRGSPEALSNLLKMIQSTYIRDLVENLVEKYKSTGELGVSELINTLNEIDSSDASLQDKVTALAALSSLARQSGDKVVQTIVESEFQETLEKYKVTKSKIPILESIVDSIENRDLKMIMEILVKKYNNSGLINKQDLLEILSYLLRNKNKLSKEDIIKAGMVIKIIAESVGYKDIVNTVEEMLIETDLDQGALKKAERDILLHLMNDIENPDIKKQVEELLVKYDRNKLSQSDIDTLLDIIYENAGSLSNEDLYRLLEVAKILNSSMGQTISPETLEKISSIISSREALELVKKLTETQKRASFMQSSNSVNSTEIGLNMPLIGFQLPSVSMPTFTIPSPVNIGEFVIWILISTSIMFFIIFINKFRKFILPRYILHPRMRSKQKRISIRVKSIDSTIRGVIENYWIAVKYLENRYGLVRYPYETHREYLERGIANLGNVIKPFEKITHIYERARFGFEYNEEIDRKSRELIDELTGGKQ